MGDRVLVVDDDASVTAALRETLEDEGYEVSTAATGEAGLAVLERGPFDALITDLRMPGMGGASLLTEARRRFDDLPVLVVTAHPSIESAVELMRFGAYDYLSKPFQRADLLDALNRAIVAARVSGSRLAAPPAEGSLGRSTVMVEVEALVSRVARTDATVLVTGETGAGKEVVARRVHELSPRAKGPFVAVHCAALPESLLESELFGYERGAFTGASSRKAGRLELAAGGTLFLDEIGDITSATQVKLLRILQDRTYERLGGTQTLVADVRVVAATHRDLEAMRAEGRFREDLFYRLNVFPVFVPPLRSRKEDLPDLARTLLARCARHADEKLRLEDDAIAALAAHDWPGNVRELSNVLERLAILSRSGRIGRSDVEGVLPRAPRGAASLAAGTDLAAARSEAERETVLRALEKAGDNRSQAAKLLGISRRTLYSKLEELGIGEPAH